MAHQLTATTQTSISTLYTEAAGQTPSQLMSIYTDLFTLCTVAGKT